MIPSMNRSGPGTRPGERYGYFGGEPGAAGADDGEFGGDGG